MKQLHTIILILFLPLLSLGQNNYFITDSAFHGVKLIDGGKLANSRLCQVVKDGKIIEYSPYQVIEYGFKDGRVYISKEIQIADSSKRVFLERLHDGETTLYYYRGKDIKTFFIEKDSALLVELPRWDAAKKHYSEHLLNLTNDCPEVSDACKLASYKKSSLSKLIARYNTCELKPFPHFRYGLLFGFEFSKLVPSEKKSRVSDYITHPYDTDLEQFEYNYNKGFSIGVFIDHPILASDFSVHTELLFSKHEYSYNHTSKSVDLDLIINLSTLSVPFLVRYTLPKNNFRPYFNAGPVYSYNMKNESYFYKSSTLNNIIEIKNSIEGTIIPTNEIGYAIGCGLEFDIDYKRSLFLDMRYSKQFGISGKLSGRNSIINVSLGVNF